VCVCVCDIAGIDIAEFNNSTSSSSTPAAAAAGNDDELVISVARGRHSSVIIPCLPGVPVSIPSPPVISYLHDGRPLHVTGIILYLSRSY